jgi:hypothetical protein
LLHASQQYDDSDQSLILADGTRYRHMDDDDTNTDQHRLAALLEPLLPLASALCNLQVQTTIM